MATFMIPEEYYGLVGASRNISQGIAGMNENVNLLRQRKREDFMMSQAERQAKREELAELIKLYGKGSPQVAEWLEANGQGGAKLALTPEEFNTQEFNRISAIPEAERSKTDQALLMKMTQGSVGGVEGELRDEANKQEMFEIQKEAAGIKLEMDRLGLDTEKEKNAYLAGMGLSPGKLAGMQEELGLKAAQTNIRLGEANIRQSDASAAASLANARESDARAKAIADGTYGSTASRENVTTIGRGIRKYLPNRVLSDTQIRLGLNGQLPEAIQSEFTNAYTQFNLEPEMNTANAIIAQNVKRIDALKSKINTARNSTTMSEKQKTAAIESLNAQIEGIRQESMTVKNNFAVKREAALTGNPTYVPGTPQPAATGSFDAVSYVDRGLQAMSLEDMIGKVQALPDSDPNKAALLGELSKRSQGGGSARGSAPASAPASTGAGGRYTVYRPAGMVNPEDATGRVNNHEARPSVIASDIVDRLKSGIGRSLDQEAARNRWEMGRRFAEMARDTATEVPEAERSKEVNSLIKQINDLERSAAKSFGGVKLSESKSIDRRIFDLRLSVGKKLVEKIQQDRGDVNSGMWIQFESELGM